VANPPEPTAWVGSKGASNQYPPLAPVGLAPPVKRKAVSPTGEELSSIDHRGVLPDAAPQDRPCRRLNAAFRAAKGCDGAVPKPRLPRNRMSESFAYDSVGGGPGGRSIEVLWFEGMRHVIECR